MPDGKELAEFLAAEYIYPEPEDEPRRDLVRVAQFVDNASGEMDLVRDLRATYAGDQEPNLVHRYLAGQVSRARHRGRPTPWPVIVTTNYDDLLEQALAAVDEPYDVLTYFAEGGPGGQPVFMHYPHEGTPHPIAKPKVYTGCDPEARTVVIKLHGSIDRAEPPDDSFVVTENDYITYIESGVQRLMPPNLLRTMKESHFLFLGYKLEDWHVRAFLFELWRQRPHSAKSWAIERCPSEVATRYWIAQGVELQDVSLEDWVETMLALEHGSGP